MYDFLENDDLQLRTLDFAYPGSRWLSGPTWSGMAVNEEEALQCEPLTCGIRCISEDVAGMPCYLMDEDENGNLVKDKDNPLYHRLLSEPNDEMTASTFKKLMVATAILYGDAIAEIQWRADGKDCKLWWCDPRYVRIYRDAQTGTLVYQITRNVVSGPPGLGTDYIDASNVFHLQGNLSTNGGTGQGILHMGRNLISNYLAMMRFEGSVWKNASKPSGYIRETAPVQNNTQAQDNTTESWEKKSKREDAGKVPYLKHPLEYLPLDLSNPEQLQMRQMKESYVNQFARLLRVNPVKCMGLQEQTWANSKEFNRAHYHESIKFWVVSYEEEGQKKLLGPIEKRRKRIRFDPTELLRSDPLTQAQVGQIALGNQPYCSVNEWRAQCGMSNLGAEFDVIGTKPETAPVSQASPDMDVAEESSPDNGNPTPVEPTKVTADEGNI